MNEALSMETRRPSDSGNLSADHLRRNLRLQEKFRLSGNHPSGFDYMRLILAVGVVCIHAPMTAYGSNALMYTSIFRPLVRAILPMFFALSGYLVAGSLSRTSSLIQFLSLRVIRIYPALTVEVILSALIIGPLMTILPLKGYFGDALFYKYLLNVTGDIHYLLPGVFGRNPYPNTINAQLWTVPFELLCYISLAVLTLAGLKRHRWIAPVSAILLTLCYSIIKIYKYHGLPPVIQGNLSGLFLLVSFLCGVCIYLYNDMIPWSRKLCLASAIISAALLGLVPNGDYIVAPFVAYLTVSMGLMNPRKLSLLKGADYSYGIFLYGFVIQQLIMASLPWARQWWINIALSVPLAALFAAASWHMIEKPALRLKRFIPKRIPFPMKPALSPQT